MGDNTVSVRALDSSVLTSLRSQHLAVAVRMASIQKYLVASSEGPDFGTGSEPLNDGTTYAAADGTVYYRPGLRIADRDVGMLAGPDVWFLKDNQGTIKLVWTLADIPPSDAPADAVPLPITLDSARLVWNGGSREFDPPSLDPVENPGDGPRFTLVGGTLLRPDEATQLEAVMADASSGCRLEVVYSYSYVVQVADGQRPPPTRIDPRIVTRVQPGILHRLPGRLTAFRSADLTAVRPVALDRASVLKLRPDVVSTIRGRRLSDLIAGTQTTRPDQRRQVVTRTIPFVFNPNDDPNRLIYRSLHGAADLSDEWRKSAAGWLRDSGFPNTVYRLPDEMRLAFDPDLGTPHVVVTLHEDDQGATAVRVLLRIAPWQDPRKILQTRELVRSEAAHVIVGPVQSATLKLGGSFPENVKVLGGEVSVPLSEGADLLLDLSLEYYQLLTGMLGGAVGLPGEVMVTFAGTAAEGQPPESVQVPVRVDLRMDKVNELPVAVEVIAAGEISPTAVRVTNKSGTAIRVGGCEAAFLQIDDSSVVPLGAHEARCTTAFPLELAKDATAELTFEQVEPHEGDWWNAVLVDLLDKTLVDDAKTLLLRANELAGSGELTWDLTVSSPVFGAAALPEKWANLVALEVEVSAPGFTTTTVALRKEQPSRTLTMRKPLADLVAGNAAGIQTATYRVRNNYVDHQGQWTEPQQQSGQELFVYPNGTPGD